MNEATFRVVKIESEIKLDANPERVFAALTTEMDAWWPFRFKPHGRVVFEPRVGGRMYEDWGEGQGAIYGTCVHYEPPLKVGSFGDGSMNQGFSSINWEDIIPDGDGCIYRKSNTMWGHVPTEVEKMFRDGTKALTEKFLRAYVEQGTKYGE